MSVVLDASALLAWLHAEPGGEALPAVLETAVMSAVNWSEVIQKSLRAGVDADGMFEEVSELGLLIVPFTAALADRAARLWAPTRHLGLSLGDRACLAVAIERSLPALTTDRQWRELTLNVEVRLLR